MKWTKEEIDLLQSDINQAIRTLGRTKKACYQKLKELKKIDGSYNKDHIDEKYRINEKFLKLLEAKTVIDAYAGNKSYWKRFERLDVITNDINVNFNTNFHMTAEKFISFLGEFGIRADIVDLDAFGSPWKEFEESIKIAKKGLIMTFGDKIYSQFNDSKEFSEKRYGVSDYDIYAIMDSYKEKAKNQGVVLEVYSMVSWKQTWRVWFIIKERV